MKKRIARIFASALAVVGLVSIGGKTINADSATTTKQYYFDFTSLDSKSTSITGTNVSDSNDSITITLGKAQVNSSTNCTGKSLNPSSSEEKTFKNGYKMNSSGSLSFNTKGTWSAEAICSATKNSATILFSGDGVTCDSFIGNNNTYTKINFSGTKTTNKLTRSKSEFSLYEMLLTVNESSSTMYDVTYYDDDKSSKLYSEKIEENSTATNYTDKASKLGYTLDKWVKEDGTEYDFTTPVTSNLDLYATYKEDSNYVVSDANALTNSYIGVLYNENVKSIKDETKLTSTNYSLANCSIGDDNIKITKSSDSLTSYIKYQATSAGTLAIELNNGSSNAVATVSLYDSNKKVIENSQKEIAIVDSSAKHTTIYYSLASSETYYFGFESGGDTIRVFSTSFIPYSIAAYSQQGISTDNTEYYQRFITIVDGVTSIDILSGIQYKFTYSDGTTSQDFTVEPYIVDRITDGASDFETNINSQTYTFSEKATTKYIVYVIKYKDATHTTYTGTLSLSVLDSSGNEIAKTSVSLS